MATTPLGTVFCWKATILVIAFDSRSLRALCENADQADSELGPVAARTLRSRLADLDAATSPSDLVAGSPRVLGDGDDERMELNVGEDLRILFVSNHKENPRNGSNRIDWPKVSRIRIIGICNDNSHSN